MPSADRTVAIYRELADWYDRQGQAQLRDRFLVLAADAARGLGNGDEADRLRLRLLQSNPHHLLKPFASFAEAMRSPDVESYIKGLKQSYPLETAQTMLDSLRGAKGNPRPELSRLLPPTATDLDLDAPDPEDGLNETLKVFRALEPMEEPEPMPVTPPKPAPRPVPLKKTALPKPPPPVPRPVVAPPPTLPRAPAPARPLQLPRKDPVPVDESDAPTGSWLATLLAGLVLILGSGWAVYTLVRPFLRLE